MALEASKRAIHESEVVEWSNVVRDVGWCGNKVESTRETYQYMYSHWYQAKLLT